MGVEDDTAWELPPVAAVAAAPAREEVAPGAVLSGCVVERLLGRGGMGEVYLARRQADGLRVVVKCLDPALLADPQVAVRFRREARLLGRIEHPNVVRLLGVDVDGPRPHLVLELVPGQDLAEWIDAHGRMPVAEALRVARDVALGLAAAHARGIVHRDLKPANVRLTPEGQVKLLDFGLARGVELEEDDTVSLAGQVLGTPQYMAPEQWGDHEVDARCDVYSLGATLYHLLTGSPPFPGESAVTICHRVLRGRFPRPRALAPEVPEQVELALLRMTAAEPWLRYPTALDCVDELDRLRAGRPARVPALVDAEGRRIPLVSATTLLLGRDPACEVPLAAPNASRQHARLELRPTGFYLHDLDSRNGTWVNGDRVVDLRLQGGDRIRLGSVELVLDDAGLGQAPASAADALRPDRLELRSAPEAVIRALVDANDRRVVVALLERLPLAAVRQRVEAARDFATRVLGAEVAARAVARLQALLMEERAHAVGQLFRITFENLGLDAEAWLAWWERARARYPRQLVPWRPRPRAQLRVLSGGGGPRTVELARDRQVYTLGRGAGCDIQLADAAVSRRHATLLRLNQRFVLRDEGSRYGLKVGGEPVSAAFLAPGDRFTLGATELVLQAPDLEAWPPTAACGGYLVHPALFEALVELRHPSVARALLRFAAPERELDWVERAALRLFPEGARPRAFAAAVRAVHAAYQARATAWPELASLAASDPGPQVVPMGFFRDGLPVETVEERAERLRAQAERTAELQAPAEPAQP